MQAIRNVRRRASDRRGASIVEAALVLPIVITFLLGILEYGRYVMTVQVLTNAAREGAHYALAHTEPVTISGTTYGNADQDVIDIVNQYSSGQSLSGQSVQIYAANSSGQSIGSWNNAAAGELICVKISGTYNFVVPQMLSLPSSVPVSVQSTMRSEGN